MKNIFRRLLIVSIVFSLMITFCSCGPKDVEVYIFSDLSECRTIEIEKPDGVQVTSYDSPAGDQYIKELIYNDFYACNYSSDEAQFDLFAYEFPNQTTAQEYFKNATGQDTSKTVTYLDSQGLTTYRRVVISNNLAYSVLAKVSDADTSIEIINKVFSEKIIDVKW